MTYFTWVLSIGQSLVINLIVANGYNSIQYLFTKFQV